MASKSGLTYSACSATCTNPLIRDSLVPTRRRSFAATAATTSIVPGSLSRFARNLVFLKPRASPASSSSSADASTYNPCSEESTTPGTLSRQSSAESLCSIFDSQKIEQRVLAHARAHGKAAREIELNTPKPLQADMLAQLPRFENPALTNQVRFDIWPELPRLFRPRMDNVPPESTTSVQRPKTPRAPTLTVPTRNPREEAVLALEQSLDRIHTDVETELKAMYGTGPDGARKTQARLAEMDVYLRSAQLIIQQGLTEGDQTRLLEDFHRAFVSAVVSDLQEGMGQADDELTEQEEELIRVWGYLPRDDHTGPLRNDISQPVRRLRR